MDILNHLRTSSILCTLIIITIAPFLLFTFFSKKTESIKSYLQSTSAYLLISLFISEISHLPSLTNLREIKVFSRIGTLDQGLESEVRFGVFFFVESQNVESTPVTFKKRIKITITLKCVQITKQGYLI